MVKRSVGVILLLLVVSSIILNVGMVSAEEEDNGFIPNLIEDSPFFSVFQKGESNPAMGEFAKILILLMIIILIYSSLSYVGFPDNSGMRFLLSIVIGLLFTILITTNEILTALQSFKAGGIALTIFIPVLILVFFSFVVAAKGGSFFGVMAQKIMWLVYSVYLFIRTGVLLLLKWDLGNKQVGVMEPFFKFILGEGYSSSITTGADSVILIVLFAVSIFVFFVFVMGNKWFMAWVAGEKLDSDITRLKDSLKRQNAKREIEAQSTRS